MQPGYDRALYAVRFGDRGGAALDAQAAALVWSGIQQVGAAGSAADPTDLGVLVDGRTQQRLADAIPGESIQLVLPLSGGAAEFSLAPGDDFGAFVDRFSPRIAQVEVRWGPDLDPDAKKAQALELTRLSAWLHETDRVLLVDLEPTGPSASDADRLDTWLKSVREVREVGIEADLWALPAPRDVEEAAAVAELVRDAGRDDVGVLVRDGTDATDHDVVAALGRVAGVAGYRGFVLGPSIWSDALAQWRTGVLDDDAAATAIADRLRQAIAAATRVA
ncbi:2-deoxy-5-keto-D-gluconate 6-phosphate aldolase domain-containing protein [Egicoccus sp. AB-alg6-2]|uniref:2-deoxy-5-keto-D-gluconate 6-phosphate aldolase domain-containing protein n=1 Tax=Egicoccus sp. AB-alg6-2 TaxID=3242692 RepID=UPI00359EF283